MTTIDNIMVLADAYAISVADTPHHPTPLLRAMAVEKIERARAVLLTALTEALTPQIQTIGCVSNCDNCTYAHSSPAHAGYCYMFYDEPQGVCAQWKDANPIIQKYPEKDISAQPVALNWRELVAWWESGAEQWDGLRDIVQKMIQAAQPVQEPLRAHVLLDFSPIFGGDK